MDNELNILRKERDQDKKQIMDKDSENEQIRHVSQKTLNEYNILQSRYQDLRDELGTANYQKNEFAKIVERLEKKQEVILI